MKKIIALALTHLLSLLPIALAAQQLNYKTSWIGNTFPGGDSQSTDPAKAHIPNYIHNIWVNRDATDGKVYTTSIWDEGDREKSIIQNGKVIGRMPDPGHNVQHDAITGDGTYIYIAQIIDRGNWTSSGYGLRRYNQDGSAAPISNGVGNDKSYIEIQSSGSDLKKIATALAVNTGSKELYYADPTDNKIKVIDLNSNTIAASFSIASISDGNNRLAVATDGYLWWLARQDKKVYRYSNRGTKQSQEISGGDPSALCIDKNNKLYIADNNSALQIKVYNNINASPTLEKTIGDNGGIYSGSKGLVTDMKFQPGMSGLGADGNGNVYLASNGVDNSTGSVLKSINSTGTGINWKVYGLAFVDNFDFDSASDGLDVYGRTEHFTMDYSKSHGQEWSFKGYTVDKFSNPSDGPRGDGTAMIRNRDGRKFMYTIGMYGNGFNLYRFDTPPSEIAVPLGTINRDGGYAWEVDSNCDVWSGGAGGKIRRYAYPGINLNYNTGAPEEWAIPAPFNSVERVKYIAGSDVLYITGWSSNYPNSKTDWGRVGRIICRYNNWKGGNRTANVTMVLDYTNQEAPKCMDIAGDYAFVVACKEEKMWVYNTSSGSLTGIITPGPEINSKSGWVDIPYGVRAFKRSTGEYLINVEEDLFGKVVLYRWNPGCSASASPAAPSNLAGNAASTTQIDLTWTDSANNEDGFSIESKTGTNSYTAAGSTGANTTRYSHTGLSPGTNYTYRIVSYNCKENSSYSNEKTVTTRSDASDTQPPTAPTNLIASAITTTSFTLSWTASTDNVGVTSYTVYNGITSVGTTASTSINVTGLAAATTYRMMAEAKDAAGNISPTSTTLSVTTRSNSSDTQPPTAPTNLVSSNITATSCTLSWSTSSDNVGVTGYEVFRGTTSAGTTASTSLSINGLTASTTYSMTVQARDAAGNISPSSAALSVTTVASSTPVALIKLPCNENTGTNVTNSGSVGGALTKTAPPNWSTNIPAGVGGASSLDFGTTPGNYAVESTAIISQLAGLSSFTITGWVNCKNATEGGGGNRIVSWINNGGNGVDLVYKNDGSLQIGINEWPDLNGGSTQPRSSAGKISTDSNASAANWKFFAVTYDSASSKVQYYFGNAAADASLDVTRTYNKGAIGNAIAKLAIGHFNSATRSGATDRMFRGLIDQVEIYNQVLSPAQIINVQGRVSNPDLQAPTAPTNLASSNITATSFTLSWSASSDNMAITGYEVFQGAASVGTTASTSLSISGLTSSTTYTMTVKAKDAAGNTSSTSAPLIVTTSAGTNLSPIIKLECNENTGSSVANSGSAGGSLTKTTPPNWSTNTPAGVGGASSLDFGTTPGNYAVESTAIISQLAGLSSFTITGWVNCKNATEGGGGNRIVSWINNGGNGVDLVYKNDGSLQMGVNEWPDLNGGSTQPRSSAGKIPTDGNAGAANWRFFAVTYVAATNTVKFYFGSPQVDAVIDVTKTYNKEAVGNNISKLAIGHFNSATRSNATDRIFKGLIDKIAIFGQELTPAQIVSVQKGSL